MKFSKQEVHKNLLNNCELCENWCNESHTLLRSVIECLFIPSTFVVWFGWNLVQVLEHNAIEHLWMSWNLIWGRTCISSRHDLDNINTCTDILLSTSTLPFPVLDHSSHGEGVTFHKHHYGCNGDYQCREFPAACCKHITLLLFHPPETIILGILWVVTKNSEWQTK
jgi:hypothetical protein